MNARGRFITLEGGEGAGKSTHRPFVADWLRARGRRVIETREPGGSPLAETLRDAFLKNWPEGMDAKTETLLLFAARAAHVHATIRPALSDGCDVVCDRFVDASHAYQGAGRGVPGKQLEMLEDWVIGDVRPDLVLVFDINPEIGLARTRKRGEENRFEKEPPSFMNRVREAYLERARRHPGRYVLLDAGQGIATVQHELAAALAQRL